MTDPTLWLWIVVVFSVGLLCRAIWLELAVRRWRHRAREAEKPEPVLSETEKIRINLIRKETVARLEQLARRGGGPLGGPVLLTGRNGSSPLCGMCSKAINKPRGQMVGDVPPEAVPKDLPQA